MTDLIQDTGARENSEAAHDPQKIASGDADAPGGGVAKTQSTGDLTHGQESYMGPRDAGESDKHDATASDPSQNNIQTPIGGDIDPDSTASSDETGQAGTNDRPGKDKAHPWNG